MIDSIENFTPSFWLSSLLAILFAVSVSGCYAAGPERAPSESKEGGAPKDYAECMAMGGRVLKMYPARCVHGSGGTFIDPSPSAGKVIPLPSRKFCVDQCGNGECQEMVCMGEGCPCSESAESCAADCGK
jgi:hypothetical protein